MKALENVKNVLENTLEKSLNFSLAKVWEPCKAVMGGFQFSPISLPANQPPHEQSTDTLLFAITFYFVFQTLNQYKVQLIDDPIVHAHLDSLYDKLLEQNLCRIIEPFSRVQVCCSFVCVSPFYNVLKSLSSICY